MKWRALAAMWAAGLIATGTAAWAGAAGVTGPEAQAGLYARDYGTTGTLAAGDAVGRVDFITRQGGRRELVVARLTSRVAEATSGSETGRLELATLREGCLRGLMALVGGRVGIGVEDPAHPLALASGAHASEGGAWINGVGAAGTWTLQPVASTGTLTLAGGSDRVVPEARARRSGWDLLDALEPVDYEVRATATVIETRDGRHVTRAQAEAEVAGRNVREEGRVRAMRIDDLAARVVEEGIEDGTGEVRRGFVPGQMPAELGEGSGVSALDVAANNTAALKEAKRRIVRLEAGRVAVGRGSHALGVDAAVAAGEGGIAAGDQSVVLGGLLNGTFGARSAALGGSGNIVRGEGAAALGGEGNEVVGRFSAAFGERNIVEGDHALAGGRNNHLGESADSTLVWDDAATTAPISADHAVLFFPSGGIGRVGIGTSAIAAGTRLAIAGGDLRIEGGAIVDDGQLLTPPDYVFDGDYPLLTPAELRDYIARERHLPGVPSEAEIRRDGLNISEFQMKLLEKIEELTLYTLEQDARIERLEQALQAARP